MLLKKSRILYEEVKTGDTGGGGSNGQTSQVPPTTPDPATVQTQGDTYDAYGYKIEPAAPPETKPIEVPVENKSASAEIPKQEPDVKTGYETPIEVPKEETPVTEEKKQDPPVEDKEKIVTDFGILPETDKKSFTEYFDKHNLPKEARDALVEIRKNELATQQKAQTDYNKQVQLETAKLKSNWYNELKADKDFGGAKFDANVKMVNKFVGDFLPSLKKMLTEKDGMMPPSVMKDYLSLAKKLNETEKLVQGDPGASETKPAGKYDFLDGYYKTN
jgi:hypothetical protein